jgi:hypothetical protein
METAIPTLKPQLLQDIFLLKRDNAVVKVNAVFDGTTKELCVRTRYPKQVAGFISACLVQRGELETGAGTRCFFVGDRATWQTLCSVENDANQVLIADPELGLDSARSELLPPARARGHGVIYSMANPRPDTPEVVTLNEPSEFDVRELLKKHDFPSAEADRLSKRSNGNIYLLTRLLTDTNDRPTWATDDSGYHFRSLALIGGWNDASELDRTALTEILGEPYETWVQRVYPLTKKEEPPVLLDGNMFRPVSRYESWQQLGHFLTNGDLHRFRIAAEKILGETSPDLDLPKHERQLAIFKKTRETYSLALKAGVAETLALLGGQGNTLPCSPNLATDVAERVVASLLGSTDWKRWASLSSILPQLAESAPTEFLDAIDNASANTETEPLKELFGAYDNSVFGRNYHCGLLWALEVLAWSPDYLSRVCVALARLARYPLPQNAGNNALATLRSIFLPWMPQTLASVEARRAAVESVIKENLDLGWKLLLGILPEGHQVGSYNQKPAWRDWFPNDWSEGVTRSEMYRQVRNYAELAVDLAMSDVVKLTEIIARWDHLPEEVFQKILDYLESAAALERPPSDRFTLWEKLTSEIDRHRKYADSDWAMPEEEVKRLEKAALTIRPTDPSILHQRLFNAYDHEFFTSNNYDEERKKIAALRESAVAEVLDKYGPEKIIEMAKAVRRPAELGTALGGRGTPELDHFLLPPFVDEDMPALSDLVRGYVWSRYFNASTAWLNAVDTSSWNSTQKGIFFSYLPFVTEVWNLAEERLGTEVFEYWNRVWPNPFQAGDHILEAAQKAFANRRPELAIACLGALLHNDRKIPTDFAVNAVKQLLTDSIAIRRFDQHELLEIIKYLQSARDANAADLTWIEFQCLKLLDRFSGASPVFLERRLATEPSFFHEAIAACFRSKHDSDKPLEPDQRKKAMAEQTYSLLHNWQTPPGSTEEKTISESAFTAWIQETRRLCEESGHWTIAQQMIGHSLVYSPAGLEGILRYPVLAGTIDAPEHDHIRRGLTTELFNRRGVHGFSGGKEELELAATYRAYAEKYDLAKFPRIATSLRSLAESYERDAKREAKRDPLND